MSQTKKWRERLENPDDAMVSDSAHWERCYIGEKIQSVISGKLFFLIYSPADPSPRDIELLELGIEFYLSIQHNNFAQAKQIADQIDVVFDSLVPVEWRKPII